MTHDTHAERTPIITYFSPFLFQVLLPLFFAVASAGYLGAPAVATYAAAPVAVAAPLAVASPVAVKAVAPVATSYANIHKIDIATPVVKTVAAPVAVHAAPVAYAAPAVVKAPLAVAAPLAYASYGLH
jgi:hypothetical protein